MKDAQFDELKKSINVLGDNLTSTEMRLRTEIRRSQDILRQEMSAGFQSVRTDMAAGFAGVGDGFEGLSDMIEDQHHQTTQRLTRLEKQKQ